MMRTSSLLVFIFAAVSAPAFAAPITPNLHINGGTKLWSGIYPQHISNQPINRLFPVQQQRSYDADEDSGALISRPRLENIWSDANGTVHRPFRPIRWNMPILGRPMAIQQSRELHELLLRAVDDESGALDWKKIAQTAVNIIPHLIQFLPGESSTPPPPPPPPTDAQQPTDQQQAQQRRELLQLVARAVADDESGAGLFSFIKPFISPLISIFSGGSSNNQNQRREYDAMMELLARAAEDDESGAGLFTFLKPFIGPLVNGIFGGGSTGSSSNQPSQRREYDAMFELLARAAEEDESGAGIFGTLFKTFAGPLINIFTGGNNQQQRRDLAAVVELLARHGADYALE